MRYSRFTKKQWILISICAVFICLSAWFFYEAYDKLTHYLSLGTLSINAYVGGDAYNYVINSNYFIGYSVLGGSTLIISVICGVASLFLKEDYK